MNAMTLPRRIFLQLATAIAASPALSRLAYPQSYPSRPIRIVVPLPPGATADTIPRIVAAKLGAKWGVPIVIENRPGAAQNLGAELVARAEPDGYTLLATPQGPLVINQSLTANLKFDPAAFVPVTVMAALPYVLVAPAQSALSSLDRLIAVAKADPGKLNFASPGVGSSNHLAMAWLSGLAGFQLSHVPYRGAAPALTDLLAGRVDVMFDNAGNVVSLIKDNRLRALAVSSKARISELPDVPAIAERFPEFVATSWFAVVAPPGTPAEIAEKLSDAVAEALRMPDVATTVRELSANVIASNPKETAAFFAAETAHWRQVIVAMGIKAE
jgi:tripartite-type tricarboxylate transporter receptor subunit TctC